MRRIFNYVLTGLAACCIASPLNAQDTGTDDAKGRRMQQEIIRRRFQEVLREKVEPWLKGRKDPQKGERSIAGGAEYSEHTIEETAQPESETHAAINPIDSANIVVSAIKSSGGAGGIQMPIYYTRDFGRTWTKSRFAPQLLSGGDPVLAYDVDGTLYYSWIDLVFSLNGGRMSILYTTSANGGETWGSIDTIFTSPMRIVMTDFGPTLGGRLGDKQWLAVDRSNSQYRNTMYAIFLEANNDPENPDSSYAAIVLRKKHRDSATFSTTSVPVSTEEFRALQFASVGVDHEGYVHGFFWGSKEFLHDGRTGLWHVVSKDGGETFEAPRKIAPVRYIPSTDAGTPPQSPPSFLPQRLNVLPQFAVDNNPASPYKGNLYAVWVSNDLTEDAGGSFDEPMHIYFCYSSDRGETWSTPSRINTDNPPFRADHFLPSIDVNPSGVVVVTWYDGRSAEMNTDVHYYTGFSYDGGKSFSPNLQVSSAPSNVNSDVQGNFGTGDYNKTISSNGYAIPVWSDGRSNDGDLNIYVAFVSLGEYVTSVDRITTVAAGAQLHAIAPNPAHEKAYVRFHLAAPTDASIDIVNMIGEVVASIPSRRYDAGDAAVEIDCAGLPAGSYLARLNLPNSVLAQRMVVVR